MYYERAAQDLLQVAIARSMSPDPHIAAEIARRRWGANSVAGELMTKGLIGGVEAAPTFNTAMTEALLSFASKTVFDNLRGRRVVEPGIPIGRAASASIAVTVGEGGAIPVTRGVFTWSPPELVKVGAIVVTSREALQKGGPATLATLRADMEQASGLTVDTVFLSGLSTSNAILLTGSGTIVDDVAEAISNFTGNLAMATWVADPKTAALLGQHYDSAGVVGGSVLGLPLLTSYGIAAGTLLLIDGTRIVVTDGGVEVFVSYDGAVEQRDDPSGNSITPTGVNTTGFTSLFQADAAAIRVVRRIGFLAAEGATVVTGGVS